MTELGNRIALSCLNHFQSLKSNRGKPEKLKEWTVLASFVQEEDDNFRVIAFGTGTSCLSLNQMCGSGKLIHDSHAEIVARRSFNRYLFNQLQKTVSSKEKTIFILDEVLGKFKLKKGIQFHFYSSQAPCGDASIYKIIRTNCSNFKNAKSGQKRKVDDIKCDNDDDYLPNYRRKNEYGYACDVVCGTMFKHYDINRTGAKCVPGEKADDHAPGANYHQVGQLRSKPGRGAPTQSMSCSDKMMKWNIMGCQGALLSLFLAQPIYLSSFVTVDSDKNAVSLKRSLIDRVPSKTVEMLLQNTRFKLNQPKFLTTNLRFQFDKFRLFNPIPCGSSISWCDVDKLSYDVIAKHGLRLGIVKKHRDSPKAVALISRLNLFRTFKELYHLIVKEYPVFQSEIFFSCVTYKDYKNVLDYYKVWSMVQKTVFPNWVRHSENLDCFS